MFKHECAQCPIADDAGDVAHEGNPRNLPQIPAEGDFLQSHHNHACRRANNQHRTADTGAVGQQLPENAIDSHIADGLNGIHSHTACHERHVINNRRQHADDARDEVVIALESHVETLAKRGQHADGLQTSHSHQNAEEEQNRGHIDARKHIRHALLHRPFLFFFLQIGIENFRHRPQNAQNEQDADERRQMGQRLENRHENQAAHTEEENHFPLFLSEFAGLKTMCLVLRERQFSLQRERQDIGRNHHRNERRDENLHNHARSRNHALVPEHNCCHVANRRECTARIGRNHHQSGVNQPVFLVADEFSQNHNHHNRGREVVENRRQDEGHKRDAPQQCFFAVRL